jgi:hypothetical protein
MRMSGWLLVCSIIGLVVVGVDVSLLFRLFVKCREHLVAPFMQSLSQFFRVQYFSGICNLHLTTFA